jgi:hypothetical protein
MAAADHPGLYSLPRDCTESVRLNNQHNIHKTNVGYLLYPRIDVALPLDAHIGEVGTGTGIWLLEVAAKDANASSRRYTGLDMSPAQFPKQRPEHVLFEVNNILEPVPEKWKAQFDYLHLRLLICGFSRENWQTAAPNLRQLLKPGGWVQWEEGDFASMQVLQNVPSASTENSKQLVRSGLHLAQRRGTMFDEPRRFTQILSSAGFEEVDEDVFGTDRVAELREGFTAAAFGALHGIMKTIERAGLAPEWSEGTIDELFKRTQREMEGGKVYARSNVHVALGRRPVRS